MSDAERIYKLRIPKLVIPNESTNPSYCFARDHFIDGTIPAYWGPAPGFLERPDDPTDPDNKKVLYTPPTDWPKAGEILSVPRVVRFAWQGADLDCEAVSVAGFSGVYTYDLHIASFDFDDVFSGGGIYPAHTHTSYPWPQFTGGIVCYAIERKTVFAGSQTVIDGTYTASGGTVDFFLWNFETDPYSMVDYYAPNSLTFGLVNTAWLLLLNGFTPNVHVDPGSEFTVPQFITQTFDGFFNVGCTPPIRTGNFSINSEIFSTFPDPNFPDDIQDVIVPINFVGKTKTIDTTLGETNWKSVIADINTKYKDNKHYYVQALSRVEMSKSFIDAISPEKTTYFAGDSLTVLVLTNCNPNTIPDSGDWRVQRIRDAYKQFVGYHVVIFADTGFMKDCELRADMYAPFLSRLGDFCSSMKDYGIVYGGEVDYKTASTMKDTLDQLIIKYMPIPDPNKNQPS